MSEIYLFAHQLYVTLVPRYLEYRSALGQSRRNTLTILIESAQSSVTHFGLNNYLQPLGDQDEV